MSARDLEARLAAVAAEMKQQGLVHQRSQDGWPWAFTVTEAAQKLRLSRLHVLRFMRAGLLPWTKLEEPVIAAVHVRALLRRLASR